MPTKKPTAGARIGARMKWEAGCLVANLARDIDSAIARAIRADRKQRGGVETSARSLGKELERKGRR